MTRKSDRPSSTPTAASITAENIKKAAHNHSSSPNGHREGKPQARMPLATRIVIGVLGVFSLLALLVAAVNISLTSSYNHADANLQENIASFNSILKSTTVGDQRVSKLTQLEKRQFSADSSFSNLQGRAWAEHPSLRGAVSADARTSRDLTKAIRKAKKAARESQNQSTAQGGSSNQSKSGSSQGGSSQEQEKENQEKAERLLRKNSIQPQKTDQPQKKNDSSTTSKPW